MKTFVHVLLSVFCLIVIFSEVNSIFPKKKYPESCDAAKAKKNGVYKIQVKGGDVMSVYCDVSLTGLPWLVIQRRVDVNVNFYRNWTSYQQGFGDIKDSFFIGLDNLNALTVSQPHELYVHLEDFEGQTRFARYNEFAIGNDASLYGLNKLGNYTGNAGDGLKYHQNKKFSTFDRDNSNNTLNAVVEYTGAWWHNGVHYSNLNGLYLGGEYGNNQYGRGITWWYWRGDCYSYKRVQMMIRPR